MTSNVCENCKKEYSNKYTLLRHKKSQVCLDKVIIDNFNCNFCNKILSSKQRYLYHITICDKNPNPIKIEKKETKQEQKYKELANEMKEISKKIETLNNPIQNININNTLNQTNHNYGSILSLSKEVIKETFDKNYTLEDFFGSQKALADFTNKHFLRGKDNPLYLCTDKSRQKFVYTDEKQQETEDVNAEIMIKLMSKGFDKMKQLYEEETLILEKRLKQFLQCDDNTNIIETRSQIKILEDTYKQLLTIFKNGDKYRIQLCKILPSNLETRERIDQQLKIISNDDDFDCDAELEKLKLDKKNKKETEEDSEEDSEEEKQPENEPKYDKTARHIGGITYGGLRMYKDHYVKTGKKVYHPKHIGNPEFMKKFDEFCENDE